CSEVLGKLLYTFLCLFLSFFLFFFNDPATTEIYTLSLHDALPICCDRADCRSRPKTPRRSPCPRHCRSPGPAARSRLPRRQLARSEEHTSELQSRRDLVCRLLLEKKKKKTKKTIQISKLQQQPTIT